MAEDQKPVVGKVVAPVVTAKDVEENKIYAVLAYIGILFLVPLLAAPKSKFAKFHANQGCVLFIAATAGGIISGIIPILGWFVMAPIVTIGGLVLAIMGIMNAVNGKTEKLPLIGDISIIK